MDPEFVDIVIVFIGIKRLFRWRDWHWESVLTRPYSHVGNHARLLACWAFIQAQPLLPLHANYRRRVILESRPADELTYEISFFGIRGYVDIGFFRIKLCGPFAAPYVTASG